MKIFRHGATYETGDPEFQQALEDMHDAEQKLYEATEIYLCAAAKRYDAAKAYVDAMVKERKAAINA